MARDPPDGAASQGLQGTVSLQAADFTMREVSRGSQILPDIRLPAHWCSRGRDAEAVGEWARLRAGAVAAGACLWQARMIPNRAQMNRNKAQAATASAKMRDLMRDGRRKKWVASGGWTCLMRKPRNPLPRGRKEGGEGGGGGRTRESNSEAAFCGDGLGALARHQLGQLARGSRRGAIGHHPHVCRPLRIEEPMRLPCAGPLGRRQRRHLRGEARRRLSRLGGMMRLGPAGACIMLS